MARQSHYCAFVLDSECQPSTDETAQTGPLGTLFRSAGVGVLATLVDLLVLGILVEWAGVPATAANLPALVAGLAVQFLGNKYFAFRDHSRSFVRQGLGFLLVEAGTLTLNALAFDVLVRWAGLGWPLARLLGSSAVYFTFSFPLWRLVFRADAPAKE